MTRETADRRPSKKTTYLVGHEFADALRAAEHAIARTDKQRIVELRHQYKRLVAAGRHDEAEIVKQLLPPEKGKEKT